MATSYMLSEDLISSVIRRAHIPETQSTFQNTDFLALANEETMFGVVPSMLKFHQEFFVTTATVPLVANQSNYPIPDGAIGEKIREIFYQDTNGNFREMARIEPEDIVYYQNRTTVNYPRTFYLQNDEVVLVPEVLTGITGTLVMKFYKRPSQLVTSDRVATIQSINTITGQVQVDSVPSIISSTSPIDFLQTPRGHKCYSVKVTPQSVNSSLNLIIFTPSDIPSGLSVGDRIALTGETNIPQLPDDLHPILSQRVVCRCLEAQQDFAGLTQANQKLAEMEVQLGSLIDNRAEGTPQKINNLRGALRAGKLTRRRSTV